MDNGNNPLELNISRFDYYCYHPWLRLTLRRRILWVLLALQTLFALLCVCFSIAFMVELNNGLAGVNLVIASLGAFGVGATVIVMRLESQQSQQYEQA